MAAQLLLLPLGAVAPAALLLWFVRMRLGRHRPWRTVLRLYLVSFATVILAAVLELSVFLAGRAVHPNPAAGVALAALAVGLIEEGTKFLFLGWLTSNRRQIVSVRDGVLYGAAVALGFATLENVLYVAAGLEEGLVVATIIARALLAVPAHATWGVIMGAYTGRAALAGKPEAGRLLRRAVLIPAGSHALYDFLLLAAALPETPLALDAACLLAVVPTVIGGWVVAFRLMSRARADTRVRAQAPGRGASAPAPTLIPPLMPSPGGGFCAQCGGRATGSDVLCRACSSVWAPPRTGP